MRFKKANRAYKGFTLVEIMITVAIIGIIAAIAIPNFMRSRKKSQMNSCIANLKQIDSAKEQMAFSNTDVSDLNLLFGPSGYIKVTPVCPLMKLSYVVGVASENPVCQNASADSAYPHAIPLQEL
jgi:prepilin-type N-terminal cleavage/methylation domain-containing protein